MPSLIPSSVSMTTKHFHSWKGRREHRHLSEEEARQILADVRSLTNRGQHKLASDLFNQHFPDPYAK